MEKETFRMEGNQGKDANIGGGVTLRQSEHQGG